VSEELRAQILAQVRREITLGESANAGRALVHLPDRGQAGTLTLTLTRQGFAVDTIEDADEALRLLEQGLYAILVLVRTVNPAGKAPTFFQKISRLSQRAAAGLRHRRRQRAQERRRHAGLHGAGDLVLNPRDLGTCDNLLHATLMERQRLYQAFLDARKRLEVHA